MDQKRARGSGGNYPYEDIGTSSKKIHGFPRSNDDAFPRRFMAEYTDYERLCYQLCNGLSTSNVEEEEEDDEYEYSEDEDGTEDDSGYEDGEDGTEYEDDIEHANNLHNMNILGKERKVRGPTKMKRMWKEYDPNTKIQLKFNRYGQPCGLKTCKLTSFIGYLVRGKEISLAQRNWSKVDKSQKEKLWTTVKGFFDIDYSYKPWVLKSASKKWKDFKVVLKRKYFDPNLSMGRNTSNGSGNRASAPQWEWLVKHWKSNEGQLKSKKNKAVRALQLNGRHTTGSRSNAVVLDQLELKEGRQIGRAELYIATHTRKNGQPIDDYSGEKIDEIQRRFQEDPSLTAEETHENDLFSTLFPKERNGRRCGLGLLAGGVGSSRIFEALVKVQEVREENKKLWDVVQTLMSNQTKLQQQYNELKNHVSASQRCPSVESSPRVGTTPRDDLQDLNDGNQELTARSNKRHGVELEEMNDGMLPRQQKRKRNTSQHMFLGNDQDKTPPPNLPETLKKPRKFQTPLSKEGMEHIKCGAEVGFASPNSKTLVAVGTIQKTDRKANAKDGQPLADYVELCSATSEIIVNTRESPRPKKLTSRSDKANAARLDKGQVTSQNLEEKKQPRRKNNVDKEPTSSQIVENQTSNIHTTS